MSAAPLHHHPIATIAHDANRDLFELGKLINEAAQFPLAFTDSDREVLAHRLRALNNSCAPLIRLGAVTVKPTGPRAA